MSVSRIVKFSFAMITLFGASRALAQEEERRGFIGLGIGPSVPLGQFADPSPVNPRAGRATPGYTNTFLNIGYRIGENFGLAAALSYSEYMMREGGNDDWWQVASLSVGSMYTHRFNAKGALDLKAMLALIVPTPIVDSYTTEDGTGSGRGIDLRATARYDLLRRWAVFAEIGLQSASVSFDSGAEKNVQTLISGLGVAFRPMW